MLFQCVDDTFFVIGSKCFQCDLQLYGCIAVCAYELVVIQFDDIALFIRDDRCHTYQLTCFVRQQNRYRKDTVSLDQSQLYYRRHGDHIHIATA